MKLPKYGRKFEPQEKISRMFFPQAVQIVKQKGES